MKLGPELINRDRSFRRHQLIYGELPKVEDVETNFLRICAKFVLLNAKQEKQARFYDFGTI